MLYRFTHASFFFKLFLVSKDFVAHILLTHKLTHLYSKQKFIFYFLGTYTFSFFMGHASPFF